MPRFSQRPLLFYRGKGRWTLRMPVYSRGLVIHSLGTKRPLQAKVVFRQIGFLGKS